MVDLGGGLNGLLGIPLGEMRRIRLRSLGFRLRGGEFGGLRRLLFGSLGCRL